MEKVNEMNLPYAPFEKKDNSIEDFGSNNQVVMDYTSKFDCKLVFKSREALIEWAKKIGKENMMIIIIQSSETGGCGRKPRIVLCCERSGKFRALTNENESLENKKRKKPETGTKKCDCPFKLKGVKLANEDDWRLEVACGTHNHPMANYFEGHAYAGRLTKDEVKKVIDLSTSLVKPRAILNSLKKDSSDNFTTMKAVYNIRQKYRVADQAGRSQMQQLLKKLSDNGYTEWHTTSPIYDKVTNIFFAHPKAIEKFRAFPDVLIMDCTYKTNKYKLSLLQIVGVTSTSMTFTVAHAFIGGEKQVNFKWALEKLKLLIHDGRGPRVVLTDRDIGLMNAVESVFEGVHLQLCTWHI